MSTGPRDQMPAGATGHGATGHGRFLASHADREQVVDRLKAAFVEGRLTMDELDARPARRSPHGPTRTWPRSPPTFPPGRPETGHGPAAIRPGRQ